MIRLTEVEKQVLKSLIVEVKRINNLNHICKDEKRFKQSSSWLDLLVKIQKQS